MLESGVGPGVGADVGAGVGPGVGPGVGAGAGAGGVCRGRNKVDRRLLADEWRSQRSAENERSSLVAWDMYITIEWV